MPRADQMPHILKLLHMGLDTSSPHDMNQSKQRLLTPVFFAGGGKIERGRIERNDLKLRATFGAGDQFMGHRIGGQ